MDLFTNAFTLWGSPITWLELVASSLGLFMVWCNLREVHWGWPLAIASSLLYWALFWRSRLYGDATLQLFFVAVSLWGWWQWLRVPHGPENGLAEPLRVSRLSRQGLVRVIAASAVLWPATGWFLRTYTDTDVPWWDAFPTALSIVGQALLGRKLIENWLVWLVVNVVSVGLFAYKGLWLTVILYAVFAALSVVGWHTWKKQLEKQLGSDSN